MNESAPYDDIEIENNIPSGKAQSALYDGIYDSISKNDKDQPNDRKNNHMRHKENNAQKETEIDNMYCKVNPQNKQQNKIAKGNIAEDKDLPSGTYAEVKMLENDIYNQQ